MSEDGKGAIEQYRQVEGACWCNIDKYGLFTLYGTMPLSSLSIEYFGSPPLDAWQVLEGMWSSYAWASK